MRALVRSPSGLIGALLVALLAGVALLAMVWTPQDPLAISLADRMKPPGPGLPLGADEFGRDVLSRLMAGATASVSVALATVAFALTGGVAMGVLAGYFGGPLDRALTVVGDALLAFPGILFAMGLLAILGPGQGGIVLALGLAFLPNVARIVRSAAMSVAVRDYVEASRVMGNPEIVTILRHVLPNVTAPVIVLGTSMIGWVILAESALSFLGLGVPPPTPTWGSMLSAARPFMATAPWLIAAPGACIALALLGVNLFGDAVRDALDPQMRAEAR
jgi:peptide/nickel transport system permease protein